MAILSMWCKGGALHSLLKMGLGSDMPFCGGLLSDVSSSSQNVSVQLNGTHTHFRIPLESFSTFQSMWKVFLFLHHTKDTFLRGRRGNESRQTWLTVLSELLCWSADSRLISSSSNYKFTRSAWCSSPLFSSWQLKKMPQQQISHLLSQFELNYGSSTGVCCWSMESPPEMAAIKKCFCFSSVALFATQIWPQMLNGHHHHNHHNRFVVPLNESHFSSDQLEAGTNKSLLTDVAIFNFLVSQW